MQSPNQVSAMAGAGGYSQLDQRFQKIIELSRDHITLLDAQGKIIYANTVAPLLGYTLTEYLKVEPQNFVHPADQVKAQTFWQAVYATPNVPKTTELRYRHSLGHYVWVEVTATNLLDEPDVRAILVNHRDLTGQKQAEARYDSLMLAYNAQAALREQPLAERTATLQAAQTQANAIWDNNPDGLLIVDSTLALQQTNPALQQMFGYAPSTVDTASLTDLIHPEDTAKLREMALGVLDNKASERIELRCQRQDGAVFAAELSFGYINQASLFVTVRDISLRQHAQQELAEERNRLRRLIDTVPDNIFIKDLQHRFILCNQALATAHGYASPADLIGKTDFDHFPRRLAEQFQAEEAEVLRTGQAIVELEELIIEQSGYTWVSQNKWPFHNLNGELVGIVGITHKIDRYKQQERQLLFDACLQTAARDAVIATDLKYYIQSWNLAAERIYGWRAEEVIGRHVKEIVQTQFASAERAEEVIQEFWEKGYWTEEVRQRRKDGSTLDISTSNVLFKDKKGQPLGIVSINQDISEQKKATQLLQTKHAEELEFLKQLQILYEISIELTLIDDLDEFYKQVVQFGITQLGFDRMALFLVDVAQQQAIGTYGTDQTGQLRAEHGVRIAFDPAWGFLNALQTPKRFYLEENATLTYNGTAVGKGWRAFVALWRGNQIIGCLIVDNLLHQRPITPSQPEILAQYGMLIAASLARKQTEAALRESEENFRLLLEAAPIATLIADPHGQIALVNARAETLFGYPRNELIGQPITLLVPNRPHPQTAPEAKEPIMHPASRLEHAPILYARHKNGGKFPIEVEQSYVQTQAGTLLLSFVIDITERQQIADALEEQRTFLREVIDVSPSMIFVKDYNGRFVLVNPRVAEVYNTTVADLLGQSDADFNPSAEEVANFLEADRQVIASGKLLFLEEPLTNANGETRWLQTTKVPIVSVDGQSHYVLGVATDITARRQAEEALRQSEQLLRTMIENLPIGVWLLDTAGMITQTNPAGEQIWQGVPNVELEELASVYKAWWADTGQPLRLEEWADVRALTQGETTLNQELEIEAFDGVHKYILSSAIPIHDAQQNIQGAIVVNQDITERKQNEKLIRQALEKEKELGELKSRFVSMASHEFRTPLATILALTETLAAYWPKLTEPQIQQRFAKIKEQVNYLKSIMEDVLELARMQAKRVEFHPVLFNFDELCRKVIDELQDQLKLGQQLEYNCAEAAYEVNADPKLIRQIVTNLLSNAIKYSPTGKPIRVNLYQAEQMLVFRVSDEGIGIPRADLTHLFEPFHRAGNVGAISGTGLGMVITKEAIELHGGSISVQSELGVGSMFTVQFPIVQLTTA